MKAKKKQDDKSMLKMKDWIGEIEKLQCEAYSGINHITTKQVSFVENLSILIMSIWLIAYLGKYILGIGIIIVLGVYIVGKQTDSWCTSLVKCTAMLISLFMGYFLCVIDFILNRKQMNKLILIILIGYLTQRFLHEWYRISIISKPDVAKLANELISVCTTIIFTAGTYVESMFFNNVPSLSVIEKSHDSIEQLKMKLVTDVALQREIFFSYGKFFLETAFLMLLPTLCVSLFATAVIDLKDYYMKKYEMEDFWARMERERKEHRKSVDTGKETE